MNDAILSQIRRLNHAIDGTVSAYGQLAKKLGLSYNALMVLYVLEEQADCTSKQLCDVLQLSKSTVHSILSDFSGRGWLTLSPRAGNKKEKIICLTAAGRAEQAQLMAQVHEVECRVMARLGADCVRQLVEANVAFCEVLGEEVANV